MTVCEFAVHCVIACEELLHGTSARRAYTIPLQPQDARDGSDDEQALALGGAITRRRREEKRREEAAPLRVRLEFGNARVSVPVPAHPSISKIRGMHALVATAPAYLYATSPCRLHDNNNHGTCRTRAVSESDAWTGRNTKPHTSHRGPGSIICTRMCTRASTDVVVATTPTPLCSAHSRSLEICKHVASLITPLCLPRIDTLYQCPK